MTDPIEKLGEAIGDDAENLHDEIEWIIAAEDKYVYFLLAAAGAAIAYAMQRTNDAKLDGWNWLIVGAFLCWAASFFAGCRNRRHRFGGAMQHLFSRGIRLGMRAETMRLAMRAETISNAKRERLSELSEEADSLAKRFHELGRSAARSAQLWFDLQFGLLVSGAFIFFSWHLVGMFLRAQGVPAGPNG